MDNSGVWRGQIDYLMEEWKRFVELREELLEWIRKAEAYLERDENVYGYTVSELEEQIDKHKVMNCVVKCDVANFHIIFYQASISHH